MKYLFGGPGLKELEHFCQNNTLLAFDFDGTLSRLTARPQNASVSASTQMLLHEISPLAYTAIVSGRGLKDLKTLIPFKPQYLVGNHGLESPAADPLEIKGAKKITSGWTKQILSRYKFSRGVQLENKAYSLSIHYRLASRRTIMRNQLVHLAQSLEPQPRIILGKYVVNLVPQNSPNKGKALLQLLTHAQLDSAIYVGDDVTDEDVFSMRDSRILSVRIGKIQKSSAQFYLNRQSEINRLLSHILFFLKNT